MGWATAGSAGAGIVGGIASAFGASSASKQQASAAKEAAYVQAAAANQASMYDLAMYNTTRGDLQEYDQTGKLALGQIQGSLYNWAAPNDGYLNQANGYLNQSNAYLGQGQRDAQRYYDQAGADIGAIRNANNALMMRADEVRNLGSGATGQAALAQTPGYQFALRQGLQATQNSNAARGLGVSGAALKGAATYATGLADNTYQHQFANAQQSFANAQQNVSNLQTLYGDSNTSGNAALNMGLGLGAASLGLGNASIGLNAASQGNMTNAYNRLMGVASLGEDAASKTGNAGTQATNASGNALMAGGAASAGGTIGAANAGAAGLVGGASAIGNGLTSAANAGTSYMLYNKLFGGGGGGDGGTWDTPSSGRMA